MLGDVTLLVLSLRDPQKPTELAFQVLRAGGFADLELKETLHCDALLMRTEGGCTASELRAVGYTPKELKEARFEGVI